MSLFSKTAKDYLESGNKHLEQALFGEANDEYHVKVAETVEEATKLIAVGYEYVSTMSDKQIYRKRK